LMHVGMLQRWGCREHVWCRAGCISNGRAGARQPTGIRSQQGLSVERIRPIEAGCTGRVVDRLGNLKWWHLHPLQCEIRVQVDREKSVGGASYEFAASTDVVSETKARCELSGAGLADRLRKAKTVGT